MATDGVKIIDGDLAHDTYEYIMELYDNGASAEIIKKEIPFIKEDYGDETDFYHETARYPVDEGFCPNVHESVLPVHRSFPDQTLPHPRRYLWRRRAD